MAPLTGPITMPRLGVSSPALNLTAATRQDLIINPSPNTIIPRSQENDLKIELLIAYKYIQDI